MVRNYRKPLIVVAPKVLLRLSAAAAQLSDLGPGTSFQRVFGDETLKPEMVTRVVFCSGKHYYALVKQKELTNSQNTAIIRLEVRF